MAWSYVRGNWSYYRCRLADATRTRIVVRIVDVITVVIVDAERAFSQALAYRLNAEPLFNVIETAGTPAAGEESIARLHPNVAVIDASLWPESVLTAANRLRASQHRSGGDQSRCRSASPLPSFGSESNCSWILDTARTARQTRDDPHLGSKARRSAPSAVR